VSQSRLLHAIFRHFRSSRMRLFERTLGLTANARVLDVGGSPLIWEFASVRPRLTFLNLPSALAPPPWPAHLIAADGRSLPFRDQSFDVVFSNSVIEHVGSFEDQRTFASEIARVGRRYWVQTPNRHFPVELHMMLPFVHLFPKRIQRAVVSRFTVWQLLVRPTEAERNHVVQHFLHELNLLDRSAMARLFPHARIIAEPVLGMEKSLIAVGA
jgi:hypothetical protein